MWLCITLLTSKAHYSSETSPFLVESPLNVLDFGILSTTWEATLGQEILHSGYSIGLGICTFAPSTDRLSSLPTCHNWSPNITCSGVATWHLVFTLQPKHISMYCIIFQYLHLPQRLRKFSFHEVCTMIGSMVVYLYTNPARVSGFINPGEKAYPLRNSIIKTAALLLLSSIGIRSILSVHNFDILTTSKLKLQRQLRNMY